MGGGCVNVDRKNNFGIIKLVAALMVIAGHMGILMGEWPTFFMDVFKNGIQTIGVTIFFLIGGYFTATSWASDPNIINYSIKRIFRIFPPLIVAVLFATFVVGPFASTLPLKEYFSSAQTYAYLKNIFLNVQYFLPGVFTENPYQYAVNGSLWSLPVEFFLYFLLPIIIELTFLRKNTKKTKIIFFAVCMFVCFFRLFQTFFFPDFYYVVYAVNLESALRLMPYYFIGALYTFPEVKKLCNIQVASVLLLVFSCFKTGRVSSEAVMHILLPYFVFSLALDSPAFFWDKFKKFEISYGLFLYGFLVQQTFVWLLNKANIHLSYNITFIICTATTTAFAIVSYKFIEKPLIDFSRKIIKKNNAT